MEYNEDEFLMLSGIQHYAFCRRQWALIHIEQQWQENERTVDGRILHEKTHDETIRETRNDVIITRGMRVFSKMLGTQGNCDVVEFHNNDSGVEVFGRKEKYIPVPIEYKRGEPKEYNADELQLCAQAICLEEMLFCEIPRGYLYYGRTRRRTTVEFTGLLREQVRETFQEMHVMFKRGYTPKVKISKACKACSLTEVCLPKLNKNLSAKKYLEQHVREE